MPKGRGAVFLLYIEAGTFLKSHDIHKFYDFSTLRADCARLRDYHSFIINCSWSNTSYKILRPFSLAQSARKVVESWNLRKSWHKVFLNCGSTSYFTEVQASMDDRKIAARSFGTIHDSLRSLSLTKSHRKGRNAPIWRQRGHMRLSGTDRLNSQVLFVFKKDFWLFNTPLLYYIVLHVWWDL